MQKKTNRKLQARGQARVESLLCAAEKVIAKIGYSKATTNEIAAEAQVSPATLYQFFNNKEEIANALAIKYVKSVGQIYDKHDLNLIAKLPINDMLNNLLTPMLDFHQNHPAFMPLLVDAPLSEETYKVKQALSSKIMEQLTHTLMLRNPDANPADARWCAEIAMLLYRGFICDIYSSSEEKKIKLIRTLINLIACEFKVYFK